MIAFHGDPKIKTKYLDRVMAHQKADEIIQGTYWQDGKGCAVGCTVHSGDHLAYEHEMGIPQWLARVEDRIFEGLSIEHSKNWPSAFLEAVNTGADLNKIKLPFLIFLVESAREKFDHSKYPKQLKAIDNILEELKKPIPDKDRLLDLRRKGRYDAADAAAAAAAAAAYAAAAAAAYAAAYADAAAYAAAADYAADAAYAAAAAAYAADAAARRNKYKKFADKLLELIRGCK